MPRRTYSDDGVEAKLRPLQDGVQRFRQDLADLDVLLTAADKEWYLFQKPRVFPMAQYRWVEERRYSGLFGSLVGGPLSATFHGDGWAGAGRAREGWKGWLWGSQQVCARLCICSWLVGL